LGNQARFLNRQLSLPVSMMSQWCVRRSSKAAVSAALAEPWSSGPTEGYVSKLKLIRRQMYGRGKIDLLRARLLAPA
jgi:transposase